MDVFLMIRRKKTTIFIDVKETTSIFGIKEIIKGIMKVPVENQQLYKDSTILADDSRPLTDYGLTSATAKAQMPATLGLCFRKEDGNFEELELTPLSNPPELPDVMRGNQEDAGSQPIAQAS